MMTVAVSGVIQTINVSPRGRMFAWVRIGAGPYQGFSACVLVPDGQRAWLGRPITIQQFYAVNEPVVPAFAWLER